MENNFKILLRQWMRTRGVKAPELALRADVALGSLKKWVAPNIDRTPSNWGEVARMARELKLREEETTELLNAATYLSVSELKQTVTDTKDIALLGHWNGPFLAPPPPEVIVGRDEIIDRVIEVLKRQDGTRICMLQGMAGVGKTTIAKQVTYLVKDYFTDGVLWADVQENTPERLNTVFVQFAKACDLTIPDGLSLEAMNRHIRALLANKRLLIVLDNVQTGAQIDAIRPAGKACSMLLTARLGKIALPFGAERIKVMPFDKKTEASLKLFKQHLGEQRVNKAKTAFAQIADLVGHLPLAITIVAEKLKLEADQSAVEFLEDELRPEFERLDKKSKGDEKRWESLEFDTLNVRASFNLSYQKLSPVKQQYFSNLGVFEGEPFTTDAAGHVLELSSRSIKTILRDLHQRGLVQKNKDGKYQLHPLLSQFARDFLSGKERYERKVRYYIDYAEKHKYNEQMLFSELDNIRRALRNARDQSLDHEFVRGVITTNRLFFNRGFDDIVDRYLPAALDIARQNNDMQSAAYLLASLGFVAIKRGQQNQAKQLLNEAETLAKGETIISIGLVKGRLKLSESTNSALAIFHTTLKQAIQLKQVEEQALLHYNLAQLYESKGDLDQAEQFLSTMPETKNPQISSLVNRSKGIIAQKRGRYKEAESAYKVASKFANAINNLADISAIDDAYGYLLRLQGRYADCMRRYQNAIEKSNRLNDPYKKAYLLANMAAVLIERGEYQQARTHLDKAFKLDAKMESNLAKPLMLITQGTRLLHQRNDVDGAKQLFLDGLTLAKELGDSEERLNALLSLGNLYLLKVDDIDAAEPYFKSAAEDAEQLQYAAEMWLGRYGLAQIAYKRGEHQDGIELCKRCFEALDEIGHYQAKAAKQWLKQKENSV